MRSRSIFQGREAGGPDRCSWGWFCHSPGLLWLQEIDSVMMHLLCWQHSQKTGLCPRGGCGALGLVENPVGPGSEAPIDVL